MLPSYIEGKMPPHSRDLEDNLIGLCLIDPKAIEYCGTLEPVHFYNQVNEKIFSSIKSCHNKYKTVDLLLVTEELKSKGELDQIGGAYYLTKLTSTVYLSHTPTLDNLLKWCSIIKQYYVLREIIRSSFEIQKLAFSDEYSGDELLEKQASSIIDIRLSSSGEIKAKKLDGLIVSTIKEIEQTTQGLRGISTGSEKIDKVIGGWAKGELIILAARPGQGKTARVLDFVYNAAIQGKSCLIFSLEMKSESLVKRMISRESGINNILISRNTLRSDEWGKINNAANSLGELNVFIDDSAGVSLEYISASAKIHKIRHGLDIICIDYLQLIRSTNSKANRDVQIGEITRGLKVLSKELDIPIIVLCQLSRETEKRSDKRPILSDLRESGNIEQDADIVLGLYRPSMYYEYSQNPDVSNGRVDWTIDQYDNIAQIIPLKFREGAINYIITEYFMPSTYRYNSGDYSQENYVTKISKNEESNDNKSIFDDESLPF